MQPKVTIEKISPKIAAAWLKKNAPNNRSKKNDRIRQYASDMSRGRWFLSDQAISFNVRGELVNGQNRLHAVILSGVTIQAIVMRGLPLESMMILDKAMRRSTDDIFIIAGKNYPRGCGATVRRMLLGFKANPSTTISDNEIDEFMQVWGDGVSFAHAVIHRGRYSSASIRAPIARAYYCGHEQEKLSRFAKVVITGIMEPREDAAVLLRNFVVDLGTTHHGHDRQKLYAMTEIALEHFLNGKKLSKLIPRDEELFPLPRKKPHVSRNKAG
jgi:hypothetical protein